MKENFRQFLDRLRQAGELVDLHQAVDIRHIATLVDQAKTALYFHNVIGYDMPVVSGIIRSKERADHGDGLRDLRRDRAQARRRDRQADPAEIRATARRRARSCMTGDDVDLFKLPIPMSSIYDGGPMITAGVVIAQGSRSSASTPASTASSSRKRASPASTSSRRTTCGCSRSARFERRRAAADLDLHRHASVRDHRLGLSRAARRRRDGDCRRPARRGGRACALLDHRRALHRRRRDRAGGGNPADRLDLAGRPLRRVHPADGRAALESAGAHQGDLDAQGRDLLQPAHAVGEHLARGADALRRDPAGAEDRQRAGEGHQRHARRLRVLARGDLDQEGSRATARTRCSRRCR